MIYYNKMISDDTEELLVVKWDKREEKQKKLSE